MKDNQDKYNPELDPVVSMSCEAGFYIDWNSLADGVSWEKAYRCESKDKLREAEARSKLRRHYAQKAWECGMTYEGYCKRFGVKV